MDTGIFGMSLSLTFTSAATMRSAAEAREFPCNFARILADVDLFPSRWERRRVPHIHPPSW